MSDDQEKKDVPAQPAAPAPVDWLKGIGKTGVTIIGNNGRVINSNFDGYDRAAVMVGDNHHADNITATAPQDAHVFAQLENAISKLNASQAEIDSLLRASAEMRQHVGKPTLAEAYERFIGLAANHMAILTPLLSLLSK
ncbi:hypothetical protein IPU70_01695 [Achromobacter sp. SD115]|uniref:hypothetical protein n=1 Tax=Achromobacter sp. SD115 TaxID=2782011 RepID=UPI001A9721D4|nr:hypothetical protein [Achromobacter sp. SD115]MBO1012245.1 hypothetical protein [Achromobacter sp. SD115]